MIITGCKPPDNRTNISEDIILIYITDDTIEQFGSYPFTRDKYGLFVTSLYKYYRPKSVYIDLLISEPSKETPQLDQVLIDAVKGKSDLFFCAALSERKVDHQIYIGSEHSYLKAANSITGKGGFFPIEPLISNGARLSLSSLFLSKQDYFETMPTVVSIDNHQYLSTPLSLVLSYLDRPFIILNDRGQMALEGKSLAADSKGQFKIAFERSFPQFSMHDIIDNKIPPNSVNDKIIMLGALYTGGTDYLATREKTRMPGTELVAHATQTLIDLVRR